MSEPSNSHSPHAPVHQAGHPWHPAPMAGARGHALHDPHDPVTEWLLEQPHIDATEFAVLFAIHKLNARYRRTAWIRRIDLCRSSGLNQVSLTRVLNDLLHKGLIGLSRHPVDSSRARYLLVAG